MLTLKMLTYAEYAALFRVSQALKSLSSHKYAIKKVVPLGQPFFIRDGRARRAGL